MDSFFINNTLNHFSFYLFLTYQLYIKTRVIPNIVYFFRDGESICSGVVAPSLNQEDHGRPLPICRIKKDEGEEKNEWK